MPTYFTEKMGGLDAITDAEALVKRWPHYGDRFDAIANIRKIHEDPANKVSHWTSDWKSVACIPDTMLQAAILLEPDLMTDKKKFYAWLRRHPQYSTQPLTQRLK